MIEAIADDAWHVEQWHSESLTQGVDDMRKPTGIDQNPETQLDAIDLALFSEEGGLMDFAEESSTYQSTLDEGRIDEAKRIILWWGIERLGAPDRATEKTLASIHDLDRLDRMARQLTKTPGAVSHWQDLLATP